ncbi:MAG TPA: ATP-binding protein [Anaerolineales bacterium]|nr:ATP-binding protein [Anaerolineales bacterium]
MAQPAPVGLTPVDCPHCGQRLPFDSRVCPNCGLDLALLSLLAERAYAEGAPSPGFVAPPPETTIPRLGSYLLGQHLITEQQLALALSHQREAQEAGRRQLLGQTLIELGFVDRETVDRAVNSQILELHAALTSSNRQLEQRVEERTAELRRALERVSELNQLKANLISNVSHELRTPLAHIKGYTELMADGQLGAVSAEQANALTVVTRATERLGRLIEDLIEFSSASRTGLTLNLTPVLLPVLLSQAVERSREKAKRAGVALDVDVEGQLPQVLGDRERLSWVLHQLLDNAIKFTPGGGRIRLRAAPQTRAVLVEVIDTGIGIPRERMEEVFEPFHQLDGSPTRRYGGTGLGLALVRLILDAHGAPLNLESTVGEGTRISFTLPVEARPA